MKLICAKLADNVEDRDKAARQQHGQAQRAERRGVGGAGRARGRQGGRGHEYAIGNRIGAILGGPSALYNLAVYAITACNSLPARMLILAMTDAPIPQRLDRTRADLSEFLRLRRERLSPTALGLPAGGRRRTPGLRREEVAALAGRVGHLPGKPGARTETGPRRAPPPVSAGPSTPACRAGPHRVHSAATGAPTDGRLARPAGLHLEPALGRGGVERRRRPRLRLLGASARPP
ncbi:hypothetical protein G6F35_013118 [Rhizopus arrhizus]|nr:hypothetical protein G6F35_013118 [Rhizopus arrhizus]